jgi:hypothetical protein
MSLPTKLLNWNGILPNQRITFVSLIDTMQNYLYGIKTHHLAHGTTTLWSASGGTGPTNAADHTDRWSSAATVTPRATIAAASQGWWIGTRPDGAQIKLCFQGASDDIAKISFSPGALFALAGTTNNEPTATDEQVISSGQTLIGSTASADRVWHGWCDSTGNNYRYVIFRSNQIVGVMWGMETFTNLTVSPCVISPAIRGFFIAGNNSAASNYISTAFSTSTNNSTGSVIRTVISSVGFNAQCAWGAEELGGSVTALDGVNCEVNGNAPLIRTIGISSLTAGTRGKVGNCIDYWITQDSQLSGVTTTGKDFIQIHTSATASTGALWPWDSSTTPQTA